jgi:hypothetical protein
MATNIMTLCTRNARPLIVLIRGQRDGILAIARLEETA